MRPTPQLRVALAMSLPLSGNDVLSGIMQIDNKAKGPIQRKPPAVKPVATPSEMVPPTAGAAVASTSTSSSGYKPALVPRPDDVLCGKTRQCLVHHGSVQFRYLIESYTERYEKAEDKYSKMSLTREIYNKVSQTSRFLRWNQKDGRWEELTPAVARDKVGHALRFSSLRRSKKPRRSKAAAAAASASSVSPPQEITIETTTPQIVPPPVSASPTLVPSSGPTPVPSHVIQPIATTLPVVAASAAAPAPAAVVVGSLPTAPSATTVHHIIPLATQEPAAAAAASQPQDAMTNSTTRALDSLRNSYMQSVAPASAVSTTPSTVNNGIGASKSEIASIPTQQQHPIALVVPTQAAASAAPPAAAVAQVPPSSVVPVNQHTTTDDLLRFLNSGSDETTLDELLSFVSPQSPPRAAPTTTAAAAAVTIDPQLLGLLPTLTENKPLVNNNISYTTNATTTLDTVPSSVVVAPVNAAATAAPPLSLSDQTTTTRICSVPPPPPPLPAYNDHDIRPSPILEKGNDDDDSLVSNGWGAASSGPMSMQGNLPSGDQDPVWMDDVFD